MSEGVHGNEYQIPNQQVPAADNAPIPAKRGQIPSIQEIINQALPNGEAPISLQLGDLNKLRELIMGDAVLIEHIQAGLPIRGRHAPIDEMKLFYNRFLDDFDAADLEGAYAHDMIGVHREDLQDFRQELEDQGALSAEIKAQLDLLRKHLLEMEKLSENLHNIYFFAPEQKAERLQLFGDDIAAKVALLKPGEKYVLPGGYVKHFAVFEFQRNPGEPPTFAMSITNTGEGGHIITDVTKARKARNIIIDRVKPEQLNGNFFTKLIEFRVDPTKSEPTIDKGIASLMRRFGEGILRYFLAFTGQAPKGRIQEWNPMERVLQFAVDSLVVPGVSMKEGNVEYAPQLRGTCTGAGLAAWESQNCDPKLIAQFEIFSMKKRLALLKNRARNPAILEQIRESEKQAVAKSGRQNQKADKQRIMSYDIEQVITLGKRVLLQKQRDAKG